MKSGITILDRLRSCPVGVRSFRRFLAQIPGIQPLWRISLFLDKFVNTSGKSEIPEISWVIISHRGSRPRGKNTTGSNQNTSGCFRPHDNLLPVCTGSVSCALFTSLLISKLFCTKGEGEGGSGGPLEGVGPENHIKLATCSTEYRIQNTPEAKLMNIKLPMYLFFIWRLDLMILMLAISITLAIGRGGPWKWIFTPSKSLSPAPYKQQVH